MQTINTFVSFVVILFSGISATSVGAWQHELVPMPTSIMETGESLKVGDTLVVSLPEGSPIWENHIRGFGEALQRLNSIKVISRSASDDSVPLLVEMNDQLAAEEYRLTISDQQISISASGIKGLAHATATLLQLLDPRFEKKLPVGTIVDRPECRYRSFMIDIGRNSHSLACLKETIDLLWFYKVDSLHIHLTDDQRFAFPSKAFPKLLTENGKITWQQFQELEEYALTRGVTIIPELEVPGHSTLLRRAYPEVFGETPTDLAKSETSRAAIKTMLDELIELFPSSPYIHIGGDEAYGVPVELQRDLINVLNAHLKSNGKTTIVWEGPSIGTGDNKVSEDVIQLNWRTIDFPADKMLEAGYTVVNAAWDPLYIVDHYPRNNFTMVTPEYIYTNLKLNRFRHYNPGMKTFADPVEVEPHERLIGFCMPWWEGREENYFPMIVPRLIPMAEIAWNPNQKRNFADFDKRSILSEVTRRRCFNPVSIKVNPLALESEGVFYRDTTLELSSHLPGEIRYTLDGSQPSIESTRFESPVLLRDSTIVRAALFQEGVQSGHDSRRTLTMVNPIRNMAFGKPVTSSVTSGPLFSVARLTDGGTGNLDYYLAYPTEPKPVEITIDLGSAIFANRVTVHHFFNERAYESYEVQISTDGESFQQIADRFQKPEKVTASTDHDFEEQRVRFVRVVTRGCKENVFDSFSRLTEIQVFLMRDQ